MLFEENWQRCWQTGYIVAIPSTARIRQQKLKQMTGPFKIYFKFCAFFNTSSYFQVIKVSKDISEGKTEERGVKTALRVQNNTVQSKNQNAHVLYVFMLFFYV